MKRSFIVLFALVLVFLISGCSTRLGDFTILSTKNVELGAKYTKVGSGEADDMVTVVFVPFGQPNIENAIDALLKKLDGDLVTNAVVTYDYYAFLIGTMGYGVTGDVWKRTDLGNLHDNSDVYSLQNEGEDFFLVNDNDSLDKHKVENNMFK
jgi:hypothetical protein